MDQIIIDGNSFNPYFILDVVPEDSETFITKSFRKKAKMWHPDKMNPKDAKDPEKVKNIKRHFKILVDSYEYIIHKKQSVNHQKNREQISIQKNPSLNSDDTNIDNFNNEFDKMHITTPNDFGYSTQRIKDEKEYDNFDYKPYQLFNSKQFNRNEFNKIFEYQQQHHGQNQNDDTLYHTTTDGFNPYNGSDLNGVANVSSYNGIMIVGDTFGQNGIGYYDTNYSDYKKSFDVAKNPESRPEVPTHFTSKANLPIEKLDSKQTQKQLDLQIRHRKMNTVSTGASKHNFKLQEQLLLEQQQQQLHDKIQKDKEMILQYQHMYTDKNIIQSALDNKLVTSKDYINEENINLYQRK